MTDIFDALAGLGINVSDLDGSRDGRGSDALSRLAGLTRRRLSPEESAAAAQPSIEHMFATLRVGFIDCEDNDALVALALIESLELFTMFTYEKPGTTMAPILSDTVSRYTTATGDVIEGLKSISLVRATAFGREFPKIEDFMPRPEPVSDVGNSGVAEDPNKVDTPAFIHPQNGRAV